MNGWLDSLSKKKCFHLWLEKKGPITALIFGPKETNWVFFLHFVLLLFLSTLLYKDQLSYDYYYCTDTAWKHSPLSQIFTQFQLNQTTRISRSLFHPTNDLHITQWSAPFSRSLVLCNPRFSPPIFFLRTQAEIPPLLRFKCPESWIYSLRISAQTKRTRLAWFCSPQEFSLSQPSAIFRTGHGVRERKREREREREKIVSSLRCSLPLVIAYT